MITALNLTKTYTTGNIDTHVLKGVSLDIKEGEFVAIMGKSGAGKSTLLYQLSLLDTPSSGSIILDGTSTELLTDQEKTRFRLMRLGYVFQEYALVPELTAVENIVMPLLMRGIDMKEARIMAQESLDRIGMGHRYTNKPSQLSGGEQQRVSIARAVCHKPKILFADEPTANLDTVSSESVMQVFRDLHAEGQTIVIVTHEPEYTKWCDRVIYLQDGQIIKEQ